MLPLAFCVFSLLLTVGSACSNATGGAIAQDVSTVAGLQDAMKRAGVDCLGLATSTDSEMEMYEPVDSGECAIDGDDAELNIWKDESQKENYVGGARTLGCAFGKAFGISSLDLVDGGIWTIEGLTETEAEQVAAALGAKHLHIECD